MATTGDICLKLGAYKGLTAQKPEINVTDREISETFYKERKQMAKITEITDRGICRGDRVLLDSVGFYNGRPFDGGQKSDCLIEIGSMNFLQDSDEQLEAAEIGDKISVHVTYPEHYKAQPGLAGKEIVYKCLIRAIQEVEYPEFDDAMKVQLRERLQQEKEEQADSAVEDQLLEKIVKESEFQISETSIDEECEQVYYEWTEMIRAKGYLPEKYFKVMGSDEERQKRRLRPDAEARLKGRLALQEIAKQENFAVTDADMDEQIGMIAEQLEMPKEELKQRFDEKAMQSVREDVCLRKAMELIKAEMC